MIYWIILFQQFLASTTHIATHSLATQCDPFLVVLLRISIASAVFLVLLLVLWLMRRSENASEPAFAWREVDWRFVFLLGLVNVPGSQVLFAVGLKYTVPPNAALAYAMTPAFVLLISAIFFREHETRQQWLGVVIAFAGAALALVERGVSMQSEYFLGNCIEFGAAFLWAVYSVMGRSVAVNYGALVGTTLGMVSGLVLYAPVYVLWRGADVVLAQMAALTPSLWWQAVYLSVFATCGSFGLWFYAMSKMDAAKVAVFMNLQPVMTTLLTVAIWHTAPSAWFLAGAVLVIIGVLLTQRK